MSSQSIQKVPLDRIQLVKQIREKFDEDSIAGLAQSIREVGLLLPVRLRRHRDAFTPVDGERRIRAAKLLGWSEIDAIVEQENLSETAVIKQALIANCQREELRPLERARAFERLMKEAGWSAAELARRIGVSPATISRLLLLLSSPEIARMVENEKLAADAGYQIAKVSDPAERDRLIEEASKTGLTRDAVAGRAKRKNTNGAAGVTRAAAMLGDRRTVTLAGPGLTLETLIAWLEELLAKARKARPQGLELATFVKMLRDQAKGGKS